MHYAIVVLVGPTADVAAAVDDVMAPYDFEGDGYDKPFSWDWYRIGGRWDGKLRGLAPLDVNPDGSCNDDVHYSDAVETPERNVISAEQHPEWLPYGLIWPDGILTRQQWNGSEFIETPDYARQYVERMRQAAESGWCAVMVDCHS